MRGVFRTRATCQQWTGPAPPKAKSGYGRRSRPRSIPWMRAAAAMFSLTTRWMPHAAAITSSPRGPGDVLLDGAARRFAVEPHAPAQEELGVEVAEEEIRVGH